MKRLAAVFLLLTILLPGNAWAHLGSPDIFYDGPVGPYSASIVIRMPQVVPGRAQINVQVRSEEAVSVAFAPIASFVAVSNTPPAEEGQAAPGASNLFTGELWLMTDGAYSIDVRVHSKSGDGAVQIPVDSVAFHQLPLPQWLGGALAVLGLILLCGGIAIVAAAAGESIVSVDAPPGTIQKRRYWTAATVTTITLVALLFGGWKWWKSDERDFRSRLMTGGWPKLEGNVRVKNSERILGLTLGTGGKIELAPDHGKLMHLYLVRQPDLDVFAHLHPTRSGDNAFDVVLPPLPEGDYEALCDLTSAEGFSSTATNIVHIPAGSGTSSASDPDDSWSTDTAIAARDNPSGDTICHLPGGKNVIWKAHPALNAKQDAGLRFEVQDDSGKPVSLEPYMGMFCHAAVLRSDGQVFCHLHPVGNFSMAAQNYFDAKMVRETGQTNYINAEPVCGPDHNVLGVGSSVIVLPYQFPIAGNYRLWVQVKTGGQVLTAVFDTTVI
jgi:hypothetical protein